MNLFKRFVFILLLAPVIAYAGEDGSVLKNDSMRIEPYSDAMAVALVSVGERVEILQHNGSWYKIRTNGKSGWVRMLSIRRGEFHKGQAETSGLLSLPSGRSGNNHIIMSTGIRGIMLGQPNAISGVEPVQDNSHPDEATDSSESDQNHFEIK